MSDLAQLKTQVGALSLQNVELNILCNIFLLQIL